MLMYYYSKLFPSKIRLYAKGYNFLASFGQVKIWQAAIPKFPGRYIKIKTYMIGETRFNTLGDSLQRNVSQLMCESSHFPFPDQ
jgi:hypothetical protein